MKFEIKNFRIFDKEGSTFDIKPLTLLTGANSSGKSSFAKAFLLLEDFLSQYAKTKDLGKCVLDLTSDRFKLGNFATVLNQNSDSDSRIESNYIKYSDFFNMDVEVSLAFRSNPNDQEGKGHFDCCDIKTSNGINLVKIWMKEISDVFDRKSIKPYYEVNIPMIRKIYLDRFRSYVEAIEYQGEDRITMDVYNEDLIFTPVFAFAEANSSILSRQVYFNTLFLFDNIKNFNSFDVQGHENRFGKELLCYLPQASELFSKSGESSLIKFYSSLEEKSELRYFGSFPMNGSVTSFIDITRTGETIHLIPFDSSDDKKGVFEHKTRICNEKDPFNFVLGVLNDLNDRYMMDERPFLEGYLPSFKVFVDYLKQTIDDLLFPPFVNHLEYIPSDKVSVRRLYDFGNDQDAFHKLLKRYFKVRTDFLTKGSGYYYPYPKAPSFRPGVFISQWIARFDIGSSLQISTLNDGLGIVLRLFSNETDKVGHLLADEGYGISQLISLLLSLEICIMEGYLTEKKEKGLIAPRFVIIIEEPETHLHPKYQSLLADLFWSALYDYRIRCIVETHSEYLIRKMQVLAATYAKKENLTDEDMKDKCPIAVYYFPKDKHPYEMEMRSDGMFINDFGAGFFDEAAKLHLQILYSPTK
jgi:AAA15 family ATPase/GTPase